MADESTHLKLPYIQANQAQKHVTHNEAIRLLDAFVQMSAIDRDLSVPPGTPADGARYIVAAGASGAWAGWENSIAYYVDSAWMRIIPKAGWRAWIDDDQTIVIFNGAAWVLLINAIAAVALGASTVVSKGPNDSQNRLVVQEELLSGLAGASVDSTIVIPNRAICFCVSTRTVTAVTGATSYNCGTAAEPNKFGGSLGIGTGATNAGVIGPTAFYADTPIRLTANGGSFTGGAVRIAIHYFLPQVPQS